jgi:membrane associated rhomboid family serine protease
MIFFLPIGHDKLVRRLPYLTIGLIALNVVIFAITLPIENLQDKHINEIYKEELWELENEFFAEYIQDHAHEINDPRFQEKFYEAIENGEIVDTESEEYLRWEEANDRIRVAVEGRVFYRFGYKPKYISHIWTLFTSMFLHIGFMHLIFNMLFLWLLGVNIEDHWGRPLFISLYLVGGIFASLFYSLFNIGSNVSLIGASGAISAVMGAFAVRFYNTKIKYFYFILLLFRFGTFRIYAWIALGFWFLTQLFYAYIYQGTLSVVAFWAHVGGFIFGLSAGFGMKYLKVEERFLSEKIEKQIETVHLNPKLTTAFEKRDSGDLEGAVVFLKEVLQEEPKNVDGRLELSRCLVLLNRNQEAAQEYERNFLDIYEKGKKEEILDIFFEVYEKKLEGYFSPKTLFKIGTYLSSIGDYQKATEIFSSLVKNNPHDRLSPIALFRTAKIFLENLYKENLGRGALEFLIKNYPKYNGIPEAKSLLSEHREKTE